MPAVTLKGKAGAPTTRKDGSTVVVSKAITAVLEERFPRTAMKGKQAQSISAIELHAALIKERQTAQTLVSKQANEMMDTALAAQERKTDAAVAAHEKKAAAKLKAALKETSEYMNKQASTAVAAEEKKAAAALAKHQKEMKAVIDKAAVATAKAADDTAKAIALNTVQEKDLARVRAERDTLQASKDKRDTYKATKKTNAATATAAAAAERAERRRIRGPRRVVSTSSGSESNESPSRARGSGAPRIPATPTAASRTPAKRERSMSMAPRR
jgi:hypothetical protein